MVKSKKSKTEFDEYVYYCISKKNPIRNSAISIILNPLFDKFILAMIVLNSITLAIPNYDHVDNNGNLISENSWRNSISARTEIVFTIIFTVECVLKLIASGVFGRYGYFRDSWNWLDFIVVMTGLLSLLPQVPNISVLRTFRVLRPLRSISSNPGLANLVIAILNSIPQLMSVLVLLSFVFIVFGIICLQIFSGTMLHTRCRITPYPVKATWSYGLPYEDYRCLNASNFNTLTSESWSKFESPWYHPQDCYWPIDESNMRYCSFSNSGINKCHHDTEEIPSDQWRWCGSNYDAWGNKRFKDSEIMRSENYIADLQYGYTSYDNIADAFLTIFQVITREGWSDIMYDAQDVIYPIIGGIIFTLLIIFGAFFVLNLLLAVLENNFVHSTSKKSKKNNYEKLLKELLKWICPFDIKLSPSIEEKRQYLRYMIESKYFSVFIVSLIVMNTITLAMDHYPIETQFDNTLNGINFVLVLIFTLEMFLKLSCFGFFDYFKDFFNCFDALIVFFSVLEVSLTPPAIIGGSPDTTNGSISAMRSFRLFRVIKLIAKWPSMKNLVTKVLKTLIDLANFAILLFLFIYIYTLFGLQFFSNRFRFDSDGYVIKDIHSTTWYEATGPRNWPRSNFDDFPHAFATVFQIISTENWNLVMYDTRRVYGQFAVIYPVSLIVFGNYIFMNLFLAILLGNFSSKPKRKKGNEADTLENAVIPVNEIANALSAKKGGSKMALVAKIRMKIKDASKSSSKSGSSDRGGTSVEDYDVEETDEVMSMGSEDDSKSGEANMKSLFFIKKNNPIRRFSDEVISHPYFDTVVLGLIVVSSITLAIENPLLNPESLTVKSIKIIDIVLTTSFTLEMILKIISRGFIAHKNAYLRNSWNVLDFCIVGVSIASLLSISNLKSLRALRALRGLRPLRAINRAPGLKIVVNTMFSCINDVMNVAGLCFLFIFIFAIFGVNYFKGAMKGCSGSIYNDVIFPNSDYFDILAYPKSWESLSFEQKSWFGPNSTVTHMDCSLFEYPSEPCCHAYASAAVVTSRVICECWGGRWEYVMKQNFDNIITSLLSFFGMSTSEGWVDLMYAMVDSRGIDTQPVRDAHVEWIFFCIFFMMIGSFLSLNLFVGVIIDNFKKCKSKVQGDNFFLTPEQKEWVKTQEIVRLIKPHKKYVRPSNPLCGFFFDVAFHPLFDNFIMWCIVMNAIFMSIQYFQQSEVYGNFLEATNIMYSLVFTIEAFVKIMGLQTRYFENAWNKFDIIVVVGTNIGIGFTLAGGSNVGLTVSVLRACRIARIAKLLNGTESINQLFNTLMTTLPGLGNIATLLLLIFFIFAVTGVQLFAKVQYNTFYNEYANFRSFGTAMISLLRYSTGENWNGVMYDISNKQPGCVTDPEYDPSYCGFNNKVGCIPLNGCGSNMIFPYMILFMLIVSFVFINLFIGVILEGFQDADDREKSVKPEDFKKFAERWAVYDPQATCYITITQLEDLIQTLYQPLGFGNYLASEKELTERISSLHMHIFPGNRVHFKDVLQALSTDAIRRASLMKKGSADDLMPYVTIHRTNMAPPVMNSPARSNYRRHGVAGNNLHASIVSSTNQAYTLEHYYACKIIESRLPIMLHNLRLKKELLGLQSSIPEKQAPDIISNNSNRIYSRSHSQINSQNLEDTNTDASNQRLSKKDFGIFSRNLSRSLSRDDAQLSHTAIKYQIAAAMGNNRSISPFNSMATRDSFDLSTKSQLHIQFDTLSDSQKNDNEIPVNKQNAIISNNTSPKIIQIKPEKLEGQQTISKQNNVSILNIKNQSSPQKLINSPNQIENSNYNTSKNKDNQTSPSHVSPRQSIILSPKYVSTRDSFGDGNKSKEPATDIDASKNTMLTDAKDLLIIVDKEISDQVKVGPSGPSTDLALYQLSGKSPYAAKKHRIKLVRMFSNNESSGKVTPLNITPEKTMISPKPTSTADLKSDQGSPNDASNRVFTPNKHRLKLARMTTGEETERMNLQTMAANGPPSFGPSLSSIDNTSKNKIVSPTKEENNINSGPTNVFTPIRNAVKNNMNSNGIYNTNVINSQNSFIKTVPQPKAVPEDSSSSPKVTEEAKSFTPKKHRVKMVRIASNEFSNSKTQNLLSNVISTIKSEDLDNLRVSTAPSTPEPFRAFTPPPKREHLKQIKSSEYENSEIDVNINDTSRINPGIGTESNRDRSNNRDKVFNKVVFPMPKKYNL